MRSIWLTFAFVVGRNASARMPEKNRKKQKQKQQKSGNAALFGNPPCLCSVNGAEPWQGTIAASEWMRRTVCTVRTLAEWAQSNQLACSLAHSPRPLRPKSHSELKNTKRIRCTRRRRRRSRRSALRRREFASHELSPLLSSVDSSYSKRPQQWRERVIYIYSCTLTRELKLFPSLCACEWVSVCVCQTTLVKWQTHSISKQTVNLTKL